MKLLFSLETFHSFFGMLYYVFVIVIDLNFLIIFSLILVMLLLLGFLILP